MEEFIFFKDTQFSKIRMENHHKEGWNTLKDEKLQGLCFRKRLADFFLIGVARAYWNNVLPKKLSIDKNKTSDAFNIEPENVSSKTRSLVDREEFWNLFSVIAYANNIQQAGNDKEGMNWKHSHYILTDRQRCTQIVEEFFKGGWNAPIDDSFNNLINSEIPDDRIISDLTPYLVFEEEEIEVKDS